MTEPTPEPSSSARVARGFVVCGALLALLNTLLIFTWTPIEATQGVIQRIYYVHIPAAWLAELAFVSSAMCSVLYLWLRDERTDAAAVATAEGGLFMGGILVIVAPLWARVAWGSFWTQDPRLTFTLLLLFIFLGYFMVRGAVADPDKGKRLAAVVAIVGALDVPLIHMSVYWFRSLHPEPVVLRPGRPTADPKIVLTLLMAFAAYSLMFFGLCRLRYLAELAGRRIRSTEPQRLSGATT